MDIKVAGRLTAGLVAFTAVYGGVGVHRSVEDDAAGQLVFRSALIGTVTDSVSEEPVGRVRVRVDEVPQTTLTNIRGMYLFTRVPSGSREISFSHRCYRPLSVTAVVIEGETAKVDIRLIRHPSSSSTRSVTCPSSGEPQR